MQLFNKIVLKANHPYFVEIDKLFYLYKNLFKAVHYIWRQFFLAGKIIDGTEFEPQLKNTLDYQARLSKIVC